MAGCGSAAPSQPHTYTHHHTIAAAVALWDLHRRPSALTALKGNTYCTTPPIPAAGAAAATGPTHTRTTSSTGAPAAAPPQHSKVGALPHICWYMAKGTSGQGARRAGPYSGAMAIWICPTAAPAVYFKGLLSQGRERGEGLATLKGTEHTHTWLQRRATHQRQPVHF